MSTKSTTTLSSSEIKDKSGCTSNCTDEDFFEIGEHIRDIVEEVDRDFPDPEVNDVIDIKTEVCEMQCTWGDTTAAATTDRHHRALGTNYTYKSGTRCRPCRTRHRLNKNLLINKAAPTR